MSIRSKKLDKEEVLAGLQKANPDKKVSDYIISNGQIRMFYEEKTPTADKNTNEPFFKITDTLLVIALHRRYFYLRDRDKAESILKEIISDLEKTDKLIIRIFSGIDNPLPKKIKDCVEIINSRISELSSDEVFTEKSFLKRRFQVFRIIRKAFSLAYTSSCHTLSDASIEKLNSDDFTNLVIHQKKFALKDSDRYHPFFKGNENLFEKKTRIKIFI